MEAMQSDEGPRQACLPSKKSKKKLAICMKSRVKVQNWSEMYIYVHVDVNRVGFLSAVT